MNRAKALIGIRHFSYFCDSGERSMFYLTVLVDCRLSLIYAANRIKDIVYVPPRTAAVNRIHRNNV
jgi:hypothetical protein